MSDDAKQSVKQQFGDVAAKYRDNPLHREGEDLRWMVEAVPLAGKETLLDVATGPGHTALAFAPFVKECHGLDLTEQMVQVAEQFAEEQGVTNVRYHVGDAENLPFADNMFEVVTCRFAAHHFPNIAQAVKEVSRVLAPGGTFLLIDHYAPEEPVLDQFVNELDKLRDVSHVRECTLSEWQHYFEASGLKYCEGRKWDLPIQFDNWVERSRTPQGRRQQLVHMLQNASQACRETFCVNVDEQGNPQAFCLKAALLLGEKPLESHVNSRPSAGISENAGRRSTGRLRRRLSDPFL